MAPDSGDDDAGALRERVRELEQTVADLKAERQRPTVGRRGVLGALAGAAGLGAAGVYGSSQPAAAQASGQIGTASDPVDVFGYNVEANNGVTTPTITDSDTGTEYDIGTFTEGEVLSDQDGDGVYTLPNGSDGIDVGSVTADTLSISDSGVIDHGTVSSGATSYVSVSFNQTYSTAPVILHEAGTTKPFSPLNGHLRNVNAAEFTSTVKNNGTSDVVVDHTTWAVVER